jgi:hypothetical protein
MDDQGIRPLPRCQRCATKVAVWVVTIRGGGWTGKRKLCTGCCRTVQANGSRRALKSSDY